jgi:hypothetical protein
MHFCLLIFYMIMCMFALIQNFAYFGLLVQDSLLKIAFSTSSGALNMSLTLALSIFYFVAIYFVFQAYKEFKGMLMDQGGAPNQSLMGGLSGAMGG